MSSSRRISSAPWRNRAVFLFDTGLAFAAVLAAFWLRLGHEAFTTLSFRTPLDMVWVAGLFAAIAAPVFWLNRLNRHVWRYVSVDDLVSIVRAASIAVLLFLPAMFFVSRLEAMPRSVPVITWLVLIFALGGTRLAVRVARDRRLSWLRAANPEGGTPVLVAGAGDEAEQFVRRVLREPGSDLRIVGLVTKAPARVGSVIQGVDVMGQLSDLERVVGQLAARGQRPHRIIIANAGYTGEDIRSILEVADNLGCPVSRLPRPTELRADGALPEPRPIRIEDLLGRPEHNHDRRSVARFVENKTVLVTGAGGSIGSELVRQLAAYAPKQLVLLDHTEYSLYAIDTELADQNLPVPIVTRLADIRDQDRLASIFAETDPDVVFHAAALKHVPMMEDNPGEAIMTNVFGTQNVVSACKTHSVETMVLISTDKAVNPGNVMGATKRVAEMITQSADLSSNHSRFLTVRFGNVLGSTGSVVPRFTEQIASGGPVTVTHEQITRFLMTIPESVELILQASALGHKQEADGGVFVLDMGEPVRIMDLAEQMIRLSGREPGKDIEIRITGLRPGEKLHEEILHGEETAADTVLSGIMHAAARPLSGEVLQQRLKALQVSEIGRDSGADRSALAKLVPELSMTEPQRLRLVD